MSFTKFTKYEELGYQNEKELKPIIEEFLNIPLIKTDRYNKFDFINVEQNIYVELKSRSFESTKYETIFLSKDKYIFIQNLLNASSTNTVYLFYKFTDALMYLKFDLEKMKNNEYIVMCTTTNGTTPRINFYNHKYNKNIIQNYYMLISCFKTVF